MPHLRKKNCVEGVKCKKNSTGKIDGMIVMFEEGQPVATTMTRTTKNDVQRPPCMMLVDTTGKLTNIDDKDK